MAERWVQSSVIDVPDRESKCAFRGRFDMAVQFDDGTYGVVDIKIAITREVNVPLYGRQLHAYLLSLEQAAEARLSLAPVSRLGLYCLQPSSLAEIGADRAYLDTDQVWIEVPVDRAGFLAFLGEWVDVLDMEDEPEPGLDCAYCAFRNAAQEPALRGGGR